MDQWPLKVSLADLVDRQGPLNADRGIIESQTRLMTRSMGTIHEIKKIGLITKHLMPMRDAIGDAQRNSVGLAQLETKMMMQGRRVRPHVDKHIPDRATDTAHNFRLVNAGLLIMHATKRAFAATLGKIRLRHMKGKTCLMKLTLTKCP